MTNSLDEAQVWELWVKLQQFVCPTHPDGGCSPQICVNCQVPRCGDEPPCQCWNDD